MQVQEHSTVREGLVTGLLGGVIVAVWYLVFDAAAGRPFHTPDALGKVLFRGDLDGASRAVTPGIVAGYTLLHFVVFAITGMLLTLLVHLAARNLALRWGLWIGLVVAFSLFAGLTYMLTTSTAERVSAWSVVGGALAGVAGMGWYLLRNHPRIRADAQASGEAPPHAPGGPRVG